MGVFSFNFIFNTYSVVDVVILGIIGSSVQVGYYSGAMKFILVLTALLSALSNVLMPRLSNLFSEGNLEEFGKLSAKSFDYIIAICPIFVFVTIFEASNLIHLFCGDDFLPSVITLKILAPLVMTFSIIKLLGLQVLYPQGKEKKVALILYLTTAIEIILSVCLYKLFAHNGIAMSVLFSTIFAIILIILLSYKSLPLKLKWSFVRYFLLSLLAVGCCHEIFRAFELHPFFNVILVGGFSLFVYFALLVVSKDEIACFVERRLKILIMNKIRRTK